MFSSGKLNYLGDVDVWALRLTWKRCFLAPMVRLTCCQASSSLPVFPMNSHIFGCRPSMLSITLTDSSPAARAYRKKIISASSFKKMKKTKDTFNRSPMWSKFPVKAKSKLRVQAGPVGPKRGVRVWASVSCWPGAFATNRYSSTEHSK